MKKNGEKWLERNGAAISTAVMLGVFFALALLFAAVAKGEGLEKKLPGMERLTTYGCVVNGPMLQHDFNNELGRVQEVWRVELWAAHKGLFDKKASKDWSILFAYRKKRKKALADCDEYLDRVKAARLRYGAARSAKK